MNYNEAREIERFQSAGENDYDRAMKEGKINMGIMELRAAILAAQDAKTILIPTPEWPEVDGQLYVRTITSRERDQLTIAIRNKKTGEVELTDNLTARNCSMFISDADGNRVFSEADISALQEKCSSALERIDKAGRDLNGIGVDAEEELAKNSEPTETLATGTA